MDVEIVNLLKAGKKLEAIKRCQEIGDLSFQEAKLYVEEIEIKIPDEKEEEPNRAIEDSLEEELMSLLSSGKKLEAIKKAQDSKGLAFSEAKKFVEGLVGDSKSETTIESKQPSNNFASSFTCDGCGKEFNKSLVTTIETNIGPKKVCSTDCENKVKGRTQVSNQAKSRMPIWQKAAVAILVVILMKACSYVTHGGENYGRTHQFFCKIGDTLIPWPTSYSGGFSESMQNDVEINNSSEAFTGEYQYKTTVWADTPLFQESQISEDDDFLTPGIADALLIIKEGSEVYVIRDVDEDDIEQSYEKLYAKVYFDGKTGFLKKYFLETHFKDVVNDGKESDQVKQVLIKGEVKDADGSMLPGVNIGIEGGDTDKSTVSDQNGQFSILVPRNSNLDLVFSLINYKTKKFKISFILDKLSDSKSEEVSILMEQKGLEDFANEKEDSEDDNDN